MRARMLLLLLLACYPARDFYICAALCRAHGPAAGGRCPLTDGPILKSIFILKATIPFNERWSHGGQSTYVFLNIHEESSPPPPPSPRLSPLYLHTYVELCSLLETFPRR